MVNLDDLATRQIAQSDPTGFVAGLVGPTVIDEVQRAPDLLLAIKQRVDLDLSPGQFLLTGSANLFASMRTRDALTGRMETIRLWPLAQAEIEGSTANLVDALFSGVVPGITDAPVGRSAFASLVAVGGYPEARVRPEGIRRQRWFAGYVDDTLTNDLREISDALKLGEMPRLLRLLAAQAANELVYRNVARRLDISYETVKSYVGLLEAVFLITLLPAWRPGLGGREIHAPKVYVVDSGLLVHLAGADTQRIAGDDQVTGKILENFVAMEILRLSEWARTEARPHHYRRGRDEVDLVLESRSGEVVAIEIKASASIRSNDYAGLIKLRDALGDRFVIGAVIYTGAQTLPLGDRLWALPVSALWKAS